MNQSCAIAILAGGQSRRMGQPKALLSLQGKPLIEHLIEQLRPCVEIVFIAGCPEPELYRHLSVPVIDDLLEDSGPLGGIYSALCYLESQNNPCDYLLVLPCDGAKLPKDFITKLSDTLQSSAADIVICRDAAREQHLYCLLKKHLKEPLFAYLQQGGRKVIDWIKMQNYAVADFSSNDFQFANINSPADWQEFSNQDH